MLNLIGLGLGNERDITLNALEAIKDSDIVYLESYTSKLNCSLENMEALYGKKIIIADRTLVESKAEETILKDAKKKKVSFLVIGDIFGATTHADIVLRAKKEKIDIRFFHNASIMNAIGITGLELYKFGKTTSMPFFDKDWRPSTAYDVIAQNLKSGLHTLVLLDIKIAEPSKSDLLKGMTRPQEPRFMTVNECIRQLLDLELEKKLDVISDKTELVGCARIGSDDFIIRYGTAKRLLEVDFGKELHCVIIPGKLHFIEEEFLETYK
jgi:diphthine methyl ester synthase